MDGVSQVANSSFFESAVCRGRKQNKRKNLIYSVITILLSEAGFGGGYQHQPSSPSLLGRCPVHRLSVAAAQPWTQALHPHYSFNPKTETGHEPSTDHTCGVWSLTLGPLNPSLTLLRSVLLFLLVPLAQTSSSGAAQQLRGFLPPSHPFCPAQRLRVQGKILSSATSPLFTLCPHSASTQQCLSRDHAMSTAQAGLSSWRAGKSHTNIPQNLSKPCNQQSIKAKVQSTDLHRGSCPQVGHRRHNTKFSPPWKKNHVLSMWLRARSAGSSCSLLCKVTFTTFSRNGVMWKQRG